MTTANKLRSTDSNATTVNASTKVRAVYLRLIAIKLQPGEAPAKHRAHTLPDRNSSLAKEE